MPAKTAACRGPNVRPEQRPSTPISPVRSDCIAADDARRVLERLGWDGELVGESFGPTQLRDGLGTCPTFIAFDWRESVEGAVELVENLPGEELPPGSVHRARSVADVKRAAQAARPDLLWKRFRGLEGSDTRIYLIMRSKVWHELRNSWLRDSLER